MRNGICPNCGSRHVEPDEYRSWEENGVLHIPARCDNCGHEFEGEYVPRIANIAEVERRRKESAYIEAYTAIAAWILDKIEDDLADETDLGIARNVLGLDYTDTFTANAACNGVRDMLADLADMRKPENITSIRI